MRQQANLQSQVEDDGSVMAFPYERNEEFISLGGGAGEVPQLERRRGG